MSKTYLEFSDGKANKFYEVEIDGCDVHVRYGKIGQQGQTRSSSYENTEIAAKEAGKKLAAKSKKGYVEVTTDVAAASGEDSVQDISAFAFAPTDPGRDFVAPALWQFASGTSAFGVCVDGSGCWVGNEKGRICRISHEGELQLQFSLAEGVKCIVSDDAWLYAGCNDGKVYDLSGKVPYVAYDIPDAVDLHWLDIQDGSLAVSDAFGQVSAINHEGEFLWRRSGKRTSGWMVRCDEAGVFHGHTEGVALYNWDNGDVIWEQPLSRSVLFGWCEPSAVYAATSGQKIHQFSKQGEPWEEFRCDASVFSCCAGHDGELVFAGDNAGYVYCFLGDGQRLWKAKTGCGSAQSMDYRAGRLYIVTNLGTLACFDVSKEALQAAYEGKSAEVQRVEAPEAPVPIASQAPKVEKASADASGVLVECYKQGGKLRVRVLSDGYEPGWNVQFPRALREEGARYLVDGVREATKGGFYRALGDIRRA